MVGVVDEACLTFMQEQLISFFIIRNLDLSLTLNYNIVTCRIL